MRTIHRLSHQKLRSLLAGTHGDGGGPYLRVMQGEDDRNGAPTFTRYWLFRYVRNKVNRRIGIGPLADYTLSEAREKARGFRQALDEGRDPQAEQRARRKGKPVANGDEVSFERAAVRFMAANESAWSSAVHRAQWVRSMRKYAYPHIGKMPIGAVDTVAVLTALEPIWTKYPVTADRVRNRIERVWSWAKAHGYCTGENPARWRGHLDAILPLRTNVRRVRHHAALPYAKVAAFMVKLHERLTISAAALEFCILTAARTAEVVGARWDEFDLTAKLWTVPASRMKGRRVHVVPLSAAAIEIVMRMAKVRHATRVFPVSRLDQTLAEVWPGVTVHGFRCPAFAADLATPYNKAPVAAPAGPAWTGFYVGGSAGYGWNTENLQPGAAPPGFTTFENTSSLSGNLHGPTIGGRIGYDYQGYGLVWGVESDLSWSNFATTGSNGLNLGNLVPGIPIGAGQQNWTEKTNWWGSSNVRVGIPLFADAALLYGLGGVAYGNKDFSGTQSSVAGLTALRRRERELLVLLDRLWFRCRHRPGGPAGSQLVCLRRGPLRQPR